jgi:hypothetical protein
MDQLRDIHKEALKKSNIKAKIHNNNLKHLIYNNFIEYGIDVKYIDKIIEYIKKESYVTTMIPIITTKSIEIKNIFEIFIENPKLKNIFEVVHNSSYLSVRKEAEDLLFAKVYQNCEPIDRPKYGSINIVKNIGGDINAKGYGDICLHYKNDIKSRITFTYQDSFTNQTYICTYKYFEHILYHLYKDDIKKLIDIIDNKKKERLLTYIEAQIHGDVDISRDIESISIPKRIYDTNKFIIDNFQFHYPHISIIIY